MFALLSLHRIAPVEIASGFPLHVYEPHSPSLALTANRG